jgi:hypothetical protein
MNGNGYSILDGALIICKKDCRRKSGNGRVIHIKEFWTPDRVEGRMKLDSRESQMRTRAEIMRHYGLA